MLILRQMPAPAQVTAEGAPAPAITIARIVLS